MRSGLIGPDGEVIRQVSSVQGVFVVDLDCGVPELESALARPWWGSVATDPR